MIDAHVHVWTDDKSRYPRAAEERDYEPARFTPEDLFRHSKPAGVKRIVLIQMSFYRFDNLYMLDMMKAHKGVFSGVAVVDSKAPTVAATMGELRKQGVRGFRVLAGTGVESEVMWRAGAANGQAMCALVGPETLPVIDRMCTKFPDTPVVIDHLARIGASGTVNDADVRLLCGLAKHKHVSVKASAFYALGKKQAPYRDLAPLIQQVFEHFGPRRIMWASDCPFQVEKGHNYAASVALVKDGLPFLKKEDKEWILGKTAEGVFFA
jgi:predicted TIM-barrel fold metal-dependent hydrolase